MIVTRISVTRQGWYASYQKPDAIKPLRATVEVYGEHGKVELNLGEEASDRIVALIADEIADAGRRTAELLTAKALEAQPATKKIEKVAS